MPVSTTCWHLVTGSQHPKRPVTTRSQGMIVYSRIHQHDRCRREGAKQLTHLCRYEEKVITDPTTSRIVLAFLRDFVEQRTVYAQSPQGYFCPMIKCPASFSEPLFLIQHLLTCPEMGKGEFECWKCCSWHKFPTNEKEWADWSGWKSTPTGFQRKRSLGSKMKETIAETLALRRRNSGRKNSIISSGGGVDAGQSQASLMSTTNDVSQSSGATPMNGIVSSAPQPGQQQGHNDMCDWNQLLNLTPAQLLSPREAQDLVNGFGMNLGMVPAFTSPGDQANMTNTVGDPTAGRYDCTFNDACYAADHHHHHHHHHSRNHELAVKVDPSVTAAAIAASCSCPQVDSGSGSSISMDDGSATMMWPTDIEPSDISISSTRPSTTFDRGSTFRPRQTRRKTLFSLPRPSLQPSSLQVVRTFLWQAWTARQREVSLPPSATLALPTRQPLPLWTEIATPPSRPCHHYVTTSAWQ